MNAQTENKFEKVTEENLKVFLKAFYDDVKEDPLIGPVFIGRLGTTDEDWAPHMERVNMFWCSVLLQTGQFKGKMIPIHNQIPGLEIQHFKRWMEIFTPVVNAHYAISPAINLIIKAQTVMRNLLQGYKALERHKAEQASIA